MTDTQDASVPVRIPTPEPGIYRGVPAETYHQWDAISNSGLGIIDTESLKHFKYRQDHPRPPSDAMDKGTCLHALCLEPVEFAKRFAVEPTINARTKEGKAAREDFAKLSEGLTVIKRPHYNDAVPMAKALKAHAMTRELLADGEPEVCLVWDNPEFGVRCKARLDYLLAPAIADVKSSRDIERFSFSRSCGLYGYHRQAAFYTDGANFLDIDISMFVFATVESSPPYDVVAYAADDLMLEAGRRSYRRALHFYAKALESDQWPGRNETTVEPIGLPHYILRDEGLTEQVLL